eukprot:5046253-Amphidinium_carterae.1
MCTRTKVWRLGRAYSDTVASCQHALEPLNLFATSLNLTKGFWAGANRGWECTKSNVTQTTLIGA